MGKNYCPHCGQDLGLSPDAKDEIEIAKDMGFQKGYKSREVEIANIKAQWYKAGWDDAMRGKTK